MKEGLTEETRVSPFMAGEPGGELKQKGLGVWLNDWCEAGETNSR